MRPLSERLQHESEAGWGEDLAGLLREAAALAKRYEDAPVGELFVSHHDVRDCAFADAEGQLMAMSHLQGQRVRLVVEGDHG